MEWSLAALSNIQCAAKHEAIYQSDSSTLGFIVNFTGSLGKNKVKQLKTQKEIRDTVLYYNVNEEQATLTNIKMLR